MACFASQEAYSAYADAILSLNRFRAFVLGPGARLAEAFQWLDAQHTDRLLAHGAARPLNRRRLLGLATDPQDLPLVSVMIRSMDRPTLPEAIESVARQTYPNIEIVVVDATGGRHRGVDTQSAGMRVRLVPSDAPLPRPQAANAGLLAAQGEWLIFLDEDDVFYAHHIERLVTALHAQAGHRAAYAGVMVIDAEGRRLLTYDDPWSHSHLLCNNFLPIHAVLFHRSLIEAGCRFYEDLPVLEDWDFLAAARPARVVYSCAGRHCRLPLRPG
jgi:Glycosyltransferases involved in cell wall biogenesis